MEYRKFERFISQKIINVSYRNLVRILIDAILLSLAYFLAFDIRLDFKMEIEYFNLVRTSMLVVVPMSLISLIVFKNYQKFWRFFSGKDSFSLILALLSAGLLLFLFPDAFGEKQIPRSVIIIYSILSFLFLSGVRSVYRYLIGSFNWRSLIHKGERKNLLIIGAGTAGELLARQIHSKKLLSYRPIGFLDDSSEKQHIKIHGIQVLGQLKDLPYIVKRFHIEEVIISIPSASPTQMRDIVKACQQSKAIYKTLPSIKDLQENDPLTQQIRHVKIEDLLDRDPVESNMAELSEVLDDEIILITGGAGSIGSEICRQVLRFKPRKVICVDRYENGLFFLNNELHKMAPESEFRIVVGDIKDKNKLKQIFNEYHPSMVFHAAAYKHVPLMEMHPEEAILNNVIGTYNLIEVAEMHRVQKFVLISTDKAVNPTSLMGASKRMAELMLRSYAKIAKNTNFIVVRFGNVLGSLGSVLPLFQKQIEEGGPITVTDPEMKRYFMTIPEAVKLILEAAKMGQRGDTYILNMGEPVKIVDFARQLVRLSGFEPDKDIEIVFTGVRPGEKLFEELWNGFEEPVSTAHPKINVAKSNGELPWNDVEDYLIELEKFSRQLDIEEIYAKLKEIIPEYKPNSIIELKPSKNGHKYN